MAHSRVTEAFPYIQVSGETVHIESGVAEPYIGKNCVPFAFANITAGAGVAADDAYRWWYSRFAEAMIAADMKDKPNAGVSEAIVKAVLAELSGGALDTIRTPVSARRGWASFQFQKQYRRKPGVYKITGATRRRGDIERIERHTIADVADRYGTAVVMMRRPSHSVGLKDGALYDTWDSRYRKDGRTLRKAFNIYHPSPRALDAVRLAIMDELQSTPTTAMQGKLF